MITQKQLKYFSSLRVKKYRQQESKFLVEGEKSVLEGIRSKYPFEAVLISYEYSEKRKRFIQSLKLPSHKTYILKSDQYKRISDTRSPQGISGLFVKRKTQIKDLISSEDHLIIMLDNISDPGNLGTIMRNCDWFGIKSVLLSSSSVENINPKVLRSSMGSFFHLNIYEVDNFKIFDEMKTNGYEFLCADLKGENIFTYKSEKKKVIILSSEAHGPSKEILKIADKKITIPRFGNAESLNVASAAAVILAELTKQAVSEKEKT